MLLLGAPAFAQTSDAVDRQAQVHMAVEAEMSQLVAKLGLDSAGAAALKQTFAKYRAQMQPVRQDLWQSVKAMRQELASAKPDTARLSQLEDQVAGDRQKMQAIETARAAELRQQLTPVQYAQLIVSRRAFGRELRHRLRGEHRRWGGGEPSQK
jgi:hypothetical protein